MLIDTFNRVIDRIDVEIGEGDRFGRLHPSGCFDAGDASDSLTDASLIRFLGVMAQLGLRRINLVGGKALLREGVVALVARLMALPGTAEVSIATDGYGLAQRYQGLIDAGLSRLFLVLPSSDPARLQEMIGINPLPDFETAAKAFHANGKPVVVTAPLIRGINESDMAGVAAWAIERDLPLSVREKRLSAGAALFSDEEVHTLLSKAFPLEPVDHLSYAWRTPGKRPTVEFVAQKRKSCHECNRFWISHTGALTLCAGMTTSNVSLSELFEDDPTDDEVAEMAARLGFNKPMTGRSGCVFDIK